MSATLGRSAGIGSEHRFFVALAAAMTAAMLLGFAPTYYLRPAGLGHAIVPAMTPVIALHGAVFTAFMLLFMVQTMLVAVGRTGPHRTLGMAGLPLLAAMAVFGVLMGVGSVARGTGPAVVSPMAWLAWVLADVVAFTGLIGAALLWRRHPRAHKRLMVLGVAVMMGPAMGRVLLVAPIPGPAKAILPPLLIGFALAAWDWVSRGRLHPATVWGFGFLLATFAGRVVVMFSAWWPPVGAWIVGAVGA